MKVDHSTRKTDRVVVLSMVVALAACVAGARSLGDASSDTPKWAAAAPASVATRVQEDDARPVVAQSASEDWFADDSARGTRPDASH